MNVLNAVEKNNDRLSHLEAVVMVSTDKACEPTNVYGMAKALAESAIVEKSLYLKNRKFVNIRYGNVLNSRGSIIPILHKRGNDPAVKEFTLTHEDMTRFVMTLEQSVDLIDYAILKGESGDTIIPKLISMKLIDLMEIFSEKYGKPVKITGLRPGEKMLESLISETQSMRLVKSEEGYMHIKPPYSNLLVKEDIQNYNSKLNPLNKTELKEYMENINGGPFVPEDASNRKLRISSAIVSITKSSLKSHKDSHNMFMATIDKAKLLTEKKRYYYCNYGIKNYKDIVLGKTDKYEYDENYEKHHMKNIVEWWKKKATNRFNTLKQESRIRTEMEVWTSGKDIDIIR
jgi:hypothetical protein